MPSKEMGSGKNCSVPESLQMLDHEQLNKLKAYRHSSPKTPYETWLCEGPSKFVEKLHPEILTPNAITLMGQLPL